MLSKEDFSIKYPGELEDGDFIIVDNVVVQFNYYIQCAGMGSFDFGEYGYLHYTKIVSRQSRNIGYKSEKHHVMVYKNFPIITCRKCEANE